MTGNNKFWRASLAGLASVAMLATMGVAASTANAVESTPQKTVTFQTGSKKTEVKVTEGDSLVDALEGKNQDAYPGEEDASSSTLGYFIGWYEGDAPVDFTAPVNADKTVTAKYLPADDVVTIKYDFDFGFNPLAPKASDTKTAYAPKSNADSVLTAAQVPTDKADRKLTTAWRTDDNQKNLSSLTALKTGYDKGSKTITVSVQKTVEAKTIVFNGATTRDSEDKLVDGYYPLNAWADGKNDEVNLEDDLWVDVAKSDGSTKAPAVVSLDAAKSYEGWINGSGSTAAVGDEVSDDSSSWEVDNDAVATTVKVEFNSNGGSAVPAVRLKLVNGVATTTAPESPTRDNYVFKGWKVPAGWGNASNADGYVPSDAWTTLDDGTKVITDFGAVQFKKDAKLEAVWAPAAATLKVTFKDAVYNGSQKSVTVEAAGNSYLTADQVPAWTRDGYVLSGWTINDKLYGSANPVTDTLVAQLNNGYNATATAVWTKVNYDVVQAALDYIDNNKLGLFTADSYKAFDATRTSVQKEFNAAKFGAAKDQISDADATKFVSELAAAWQKLEFVHEGNALDPNNKSFTFRLYSSKLDEHFYSQDQDEILSTALNELGYQVEAPLFQTVPKAVAGSAEEGAYAKLADFSKIYGITYEIDEKTGQTVEVTKPETDVQKASEAALAEVAKPVLTDVARFYNRTTGDHVWSTDAAEQATLKADAAWNYEGTAFYVPSYTGKTPVTRLYNPATDRHLLSVDPAEQSNLTKNAGWTVDGVVFNGI